MEIATVDGVDGVFFGPTDLSADMGFIGQPGHEKVTEAIAKGASKVAAIGKPTGILIADLQLVAKWLSSGFSFVACGSDIGLLARGAENLRAQVGKMLSG